MTRPRRTIAAVLGATLLTVAGLLPAAPATGAPRVGTTATAPTPFVLDHRCLEHFEGRYTAAPALRVDDDDAESITLVFPHLVPEIIRGLSADTTRIELKGPGGLLQLAPSAISTSALTFEVPPGVLEAGTPKPVHVQSLMWTDCPSSVDLDNFFELLLDVRLDVVADGPLAPVIDLETVPGTTWALTYDGTGDGEAQTAAWGDTIVLRGEPGYFLGGPEGRAAGGFLAADIRAVPYTIYAALDPPVISADGSTATVTLPATRPEDGQGDDVNVWEYTSLTVAQVGGAGGTGTAVAVADLLIGPAAVTGVVPRLTAPPRLYRTVRADPGDWGPNGVTLGYQWLRDGRPIAGAVAPTYRPRLADYGHRLSVTITGSSPGAQPLSLTSTPLRVRLR